MLILGSQAVVVCVCRPLLAGTFYCLQEPFSFSQASSVFHHWRAAGLHFSNPTSDKELIICFKKRQESPGPL